MSITVQCPACDATFQVKEKYRGRSGGCPKCGATLLIPAELDEPPRPPKRDKQREGVSGVSLIDVDLIRGPGREPKPQPSSNAEPKSQSIDALFKQPQGPAPLLEALPSPKLTQAESLRRQRLVKNFSMVLLWLTIGGIAVVLGVYGSVQLFGWAYRTMRLELGLPERPGTQTSQTPALESSDAGFLPLPAEHPPNVSTRGADRMVTVIRLNRRAVTIMRRMVDEASVRREAPAFAATLQQLVEFGKNLEPSDLSNEERTALWAAYGKQLQEAVSRYVAEFQRLRSSSVLKPLVETYVKPELARLGVQDESVLGPASDSQPQVEASRPAPAHASETSPAPKEREPAPAPSKPKIASIDDALAALTNRKAGAKTEYREAIDFLRTAPRNERRDERLAALDAFMLTDNAAAEAAFEAWVELAGRDAEKRLIELAYLVDNRPFDRQLPNLLAQYPSAHAYDALAFMLTKFDLAERAAEALVRCGAAAEESVWKALVHQSFIVQEHAIEVLGQIGTKRSLKRLEAVAKSNQLVYDEAFAAAQAIKVREGLEK
ncbi:MAG: hypothetical protein K1X74_22205 [Pirellulales bacterium]|nr:hypothetical protein [Pirellulales bacterium]